MERQSVGQLFNNNSMKTKILLLAMLVGLAAAIFSNRLRSAEAAPGQTRHERAEVKITKVLSAKDGVAVFRAYLVNWKGQEVVVQDPLAQTEYKVGDMAPVLVMWLPNPAKPGTELLNFQAVPQKR